MIMARLINEMKLSALIDDVDNGYEDSRIARQEIKEAFDKLIEASESLEKILDKQINIYKELIK